MKQITLLYWEECPSYEEALRRIEEVLQEEGVEVPLKAIRVETDEEAERLRFPGSPTILIDGKDIQPEGAGGPFRLACRLYRLDDGRPSPLPTKEMIRRAVRMAKTSNREEG